MVIAPGLERMQSFALFLVAIVVAVHHRELAAHRGGAAPHRVLQETAEADAMATGVLQAPAPAPARSLKQLIGEQLWEEIDEKLDQMMDETVHDQLAALEKREGASVDELREQMRNIGRDCHDEAARSAEDERGRLKAVLEISEKVTMLEKHTEALQVQVDELKRTSDDDERRRMQRTTDADSTAHIIIRNTVSSAVASMGRGRRRSQEEHPCDGRSLPKRVVAVGIVCCASSGDGHRRMQADCALPAACPSEACAATFVDFYDDCGVNLAEQLGEYTPLYESCQGMRQGSSSIAMQLGVECTEDGVSDGDCIPECNVEVHGFLLLLNIDGSDMKFTCQLHHTLYSWIGGAVRYHSFLLPQYLALAHF